MNNASEIFALLAIFISSISAYYAYRANRNTRESIEIASYPTLRSNIYIPMNRHDVTAISISLYNTHQSVSITNINVSITVSGPNQKKWVPILRSFSIKDIRFDPINSGSADTTYYFDFITLLTKHFPDLVQQFQEKAMPMKKMDGTLSDKKLVREETHYRVGNPYHLHVKIIARYSPEIIKSRGVVFTSYYTIFPKFNIEDEYRTLTGWEIEASPSLPPSHH